MTSPSGSVDDDVVAEVRLHADEAGDARRADGMFDLHRQRQVGQAVAVVGEELRLVADETFDRLQALADVRREARLDERDLPVVDVAAEQFELLAAFRQDEVVRQALAVVEEVILDDIAAIAQADDEIVVAVVGVVLHHVPQDRPIADVTIGLGTLSPASRIRMPRPPQNNTTFMVVIRRDQSVRKLTCDWCSAAARLRRKSVLPLSENYAMCWRESLAEIVLEICRRHRPPFPRALRITPCGNIKSPDQATTSLRATRGLR